MIKRRARGVALDCAAHTSTGSTCPGARSCAAWAPPWRCRSSTRWATGVTAYLSNGGTLAEHASPEDDEAQLYDRNGGHGDGRRDRAHRDLSVDVPLRPPPGTQDTCCSAAPTRRRPTVPVAGPAARRPVGGRRRRRGQPLPRLRLRPPRRPASAPSGQHRVRSVGPRVLAGDGDANRHHDRGRLDAVDRPGSSWRGMRRSEVSALRWADVDAVADGDGVLVTVAWFSVPASPASRNPRPGRNGPRWVPRSCRECWRDCLEPLGLADNVLSNLSNRMFPLTPSMRARARTSTP